MTTMMSELKELIEMRNNGDITKEEYSEIKLSIIRKYTNLIQDDENDEEDEEDVEVNDISDKIYLITKPEQSGKTREVLDKIVQAYKHEKSISIIFCDNSLLQVSQTKKRTDSTKELERSLELSSKSPDCKKVNELIGIFEDARENYSVILCCANSTQIHGNINKFLKRCSESNSSSLKKLKFEIYFDEASKTAITEKMSNQVREWEKLNNVKKIYFIDATPEDFKKGLFTSYNELKLATRNNMSEEHCSETYVGINDLNHIEVEPLSKENCVEYAERILTISPLNSNDYAFIPAGHAVKTHDRMREMLLKHNTVVIVLNGSDKSFSIQYVDENNHTRTQKIPFEKNVISNNEINEIIEFNALPLAKKHSKALVITGGKVPGRGLSFQKPGLLFTRAIFGPGVANNNMERSQKLGRLKGNIRSFPNWKTSTIHCSKKFWEGCSIMEHTTRWLCKQSDLGEPGNEIIMNHSKLHKELNRKKNEYLLPTKEPLIKKFYGEEGHKQMIDWFKYNLKAKMPNKRGPNKKKITNGFYKGSIRKGLEILSTNEVNKEKKWGFGKEPNFRSYPCYTDVNDQNTLEWWLIYNE